MRIGAVVMRYAIITSHSPRDRGLGLSYIMITVKPPINAPSNNRRPSLHPKPYAGVLFHVSGYISVENSPIFVPKKAAGREKYPLLDHNACTMAVNLGFYGVQHLNMFGKSVLVLLITKGSDFPFVDGLYVILILNRATKYLLATKLSKG